MIDEYRKNVQGLELLVKNAFPEQNNNGASQIESEPDSSAIPQRMMPGVDEWINKSCIPIVPLLISKTRLCVHSVLQAFPNEEWCLERFPRWTRSVVSAVHTAIRNFAHWLDKTPLTSAALVAHIYQKALLLPPAPSCDLWDAVGETLCTESYIAYSKSFVVLHTTLSFFFSFQMSHDDRMILWVSMFC